VLAPGPFAHQIGIVKQAQRRRFEKQPLQLSMTPMFDLELEVQFLSQTLKPAHIAAISALSRLR
jgi:hypothetical protein